MRPHFLPRTAYRPSPATALYLQFREDGLSRLRAVWLALSIVVEDFLDPEGPRLP